MHFVSSSSGCHRRPSKVDAMMIEVVIQQCLDRTGFKYMMACGHREGHEITRPLVVVLDDDSYEEKLGQRPLGEIHSSVLWVKEDQMYGREQLNTVFICHLRLIFNHCSPLLPV
jgi:hypothetical protein